MIRKNWFFFFFRDIVHIPCFGNKDVIYIGRVLSNRYDNGVPIYDVG